MQRDNQLDPTQQHPLDNRRRVTNSSRESNYFSNNKVADSSRDSRKRSSSKDIDALEKKCSVLSKLHENLKNKEQIKTKLMNRQQKFHNKIKQEFEHRKQLLEEAKMKQLDSNRRKAQETRIQNKMSL